MDVAETSQDPSYKVYSTRIMCVRYRGGYVEYQKGMSSTVGDYGGKLLHKLYYYNKTRNV